MKFAHECKFVVWTFSPPKPVLISSLGDIFSKYGFLSALTHCLLKKGRKEIQILSGGRVLNMLSMPTRCIDQHAGLVGEQVKNDVYFFVIHQDFHPRQVKTVLSKQVSENIFYLSTTSHSLIKRICCSENCHTRLYFWSCWDLGTIDSLNLSKCIASCYSQIFFSSCFVRWHKWDFMLLFTGCC